MRQVSPAAGAAPLRARSPKSRWPAGNASIRASRGGTNADHGMASSTVHVRSTSRESSAVPWTKQPFAMPAASHSWIAGAPSR